MPSDTRSSARQAEQAAASSSPPSAKSTGKGTKRKADDASPTAAKTKRGRPGKSEAKEQKTLEEIVPSLKTNGSNADEDGEGGQREERDDEGKAVNGHSKDYETDSNDHPEEKTGENNGTHGESKLKESDVEMTDAKLNDEDETKAISDKNQINGETEKTNGETKKTNGDSGDINDDTEKDDGDTKKTNALDQVKADEADNGKTNKSDAEQKKDDPPVKEKAIEEDSKREDSLPSNILEKGIIYFFTRGRVGVDDPDSTQDLARSYFVMRPLPGGAKITDGTIQDMKNNRLIALPKKVWPKSGKDRFMVFVEKAQATNQVLKDEFYSGSEYSTKTSGTRSQPEVTPLGEGVYAITSTGGGQGTTHLAYMLTIPETLGDVQKDVGLAAKGSFVLSLKNPESSGPAYAQLPQKPDFPSEVIEEFRGRGWMPPQAKHLDYANAQMLLIGEDFESSNNLEAAPKDEKDATKVSPEEELKNLEEEDESRVENLRGDDTIFADLGLSSKDYPKVKTTW